MVLPFWSVGWAVGAALLLFASEQVLWLPPRLGPQPIDPSFNSLAALWFAVASVTAWMAARKLRQRASVGRVLVLLLFAMPFAAVVTIEVARGQPLRLLGFLTFLALFGIYLYRNKSVIAYFGAQQANEPT